MSNLPSAGDAPSGASAPPRAPLPPGPTDRVLETLAALLEETVDVVATASPDGVVTYLNRAARRLFGVPEHGPVPALSVGDMYPDGARRRLLEDGIPAAVRDGPWAGGSTLLLPAGPELPLIVNRKTVDPRWWRHSRT